MAIIVTNPQTQEKTLTHQGCVVKVRKFLDSRNHSDTLDYTDFRTTEVTQALVYLGRHGVPPGQWHNDATRDLEVHERFAWIDCTNLFTWRGSDHREPVVDVEWAMVIPGFIEDYEAWQAHIAERDRKNAEEARLAEEARVLAKEEAERNRPTTGKRMEVFKGRKVPVGTIGTVAWISAATGSVLLKKDHEWQNRQAQGVWVAPQNLRARA